MVTVDFGAQADAQAAFRPQKPIIQAKKVDVATLIGRMGLIYPIMQTSTIDTALC